MKERPTIFSGEMVRAILEGRKTQTRRVVKPQPPIWCTEFGYTAFTPKQHISGRGLWEGDPAEKFFKCPFGVRRDRLWVRETFGVLVVSGDRRLKYRADFLKLPLKWRSSIFMPREYSRIDLELTNIRVERVQDISFDDCYAEGIKTYAATIQGVNLHMSPFQTFHRLWDSLNKKPKPKKKGGIITHYESFPWSESSRDPRTEINGKPHYCYPNPWVWVLEFKKL